MGTGRQYDEEFKKQAIKLGKEVGIKATKVQSAKLWNRLDLSINLTENRMASPRQTVKLANLTIFRGDKSENYTMAELKTIIWRYYMGYWANRRLCTANGGLPPAVMRKQYYECADIAA